MPRSSPTDSDLQSAVRAAFSAAVDYCDSDLAPPRNRAQDYYDGAVYTREDAPETPEDNEGRSSIVMREVADIVHAQLPEIIRVFAAGEHIAEFEPTGPEDEEQARQQTDYVNYVINSDGNCWFTTLHDAVHDALVKKIGVFKWWWDTAERVTVHHYTGLSPVAAAQLRADPEIEVLEEAMSPGAYGTAQGLPPALPGAAGAIPSPAAPGPMQAPMAEGVPPQVAAGPMMPPAPAGAAAGGASSPVPLPPSDPYASIDMVVRRTRRIGRLCLCAVPPEEFLIDREARDVETAGYVGHRSLPTVSEVVEMGYPFDVVAEQAQPDMEFGLNDEADRRQPGRDLRSGGADMDRSTWRVLYVEHYIRYDADGDGVAELHMVRTIGPDCTVVLSDEVVAEAGFAVMSPVRVPHAVVGKSTADLVTDLQDLKTNIMRRTLDSLGESIFPKTAVVESAVNLDDVLNNEVGGIIRMKAPGMVQPLAQPFIGTQALQVVAYLDEVRAQRTGTTRASQGLDPEVLQSTTKTAVQNTVEASQSRVEMIARTMAETGVRKLFTGVLRCITQNQDRPRTIRLRGRWVEVDPRSWDADKDVRVNIGLGRGTDDMKMAFLVQIAAKQEQILAQFGPNNPLVSVPQLRATYAEMLRIAGWKNADRFFKNPSEAEVQQALASQQPRPDPATLLAQVEAQKAQAQAQSDQAKLRLDAEKARMEDDRERDKAYMDFALEAAKIEAQFGAQVNVAMVKAEVERNRDLAKLQQERETVQAQQALQLEQARMQMEAQREQAQQGLAVQHAKNLMADRAAREKAQMAGFGRPVQPGRARPQ